MWNERVRTQPQRLHGYGLLARRAVLCAVASMIQLTYEPAFDAFHAAFRALRLRGLFRKENPLHRHHVRILDFYQLFPHRLAQIRLTPQHRKFKRLAASYENKRPYGDQPDDKMLFDRMEPLQTTALDENAERELYTSVDSDQLTLKAQNDAYNLVQLLQSELGRARHDRDATLLAIADSGAFINSLEQKLAAPGQNG